MTFEGMSGATEEASGPSASPLFVGGGVTGALARTLDWESTLLGPAEEWPPSLRTSFNLALGSRFPIALYWGPEFVMLYNDSLIPMVGANKHPRAMGRPAFEVLPEIRQIIEPLLLHVSRTGEATWSEDLMLPLVRGAGPEEGYFTFTYSPIHDESGQVAGVFCAVMETTGKVIEERRLRLLNALAEATQARTAEEACAQAMPRIARFPNDVPFALLYLLDEGAGIARLAGTANLEPGTPRSPVTIAFGDGSVWPFEQALAHASPPFAEVPAGVPGSRGATILPIERSGGGRPFGFLVAGLSPLLASSESYARFHKLLASSVSQAVSNAAAYEEEKKRAESLAELDRAKTAFFSNISHEFRTPLTLMLAPIQDMQAMPEGAPLDPQSLELLHRNARRLLKLVNTLLEFSRIEAGRVEAVYQPVDLSALTLDLASSFRAAIEGAGLTLAVDCAPLREPVYVDCDMWERIVLNLLSNAFKFTFEGTIAVYLRMEGGVAELEVTDTGTGIPEHELPRLFERFHRVEDARSRSHEGSGIGLALVYELVRLHGGEIRVHSRVGEGTTFRVRVPRGSAHLPPAQIRAERAVPSILAEASTFVAEASRWAGAPGATDLAAALAARAPGRKERIVFADDNADMRDYVTRLLRERWTVEAVSDGAAALESVRRAPPDLVLCDVMMPGLDGFSLVKAMRADATLRGVPVIILSARAGEDEAAKGLNAGANDYVAKPFSARELLVRIASTLATARASREMADLEERQRVNFYRHFMQAPFPVAVFRGPDHSIELANPAVLSAWGQGPEVLGRPLAEAVPALKDQLFIDYLDDVFRTGRAHEGLGELVRLPTGPGGALEDRYYNYIYAPLRSTDGAVEGVLLSAFDVSLQVLARKELERALEQLKAATEERSRALEQAHRANRAKDEFLATMSHELRTPLNAIVGWSSLLQTGCVSPENTPRALETIERNARVQSRLIEDMLDLARIEQGKLLLSVGPTELVRVVEAALDSVRIAAEAKGIRLQPVLDSHATIIGDADRLQQVAWNLLSNAIKFTPKGGRVHVHVRRRESYVELVVADDGMGIDPEFLPHVFDCFRQADAKISRKAGGLGLGLAIVRSIVELHGGTVTAQSDGLGRGATFTIRLPTAPLRADAAPAAPDAPPALSGPKFECPGVLSGLRILVVDDEADTRALLRFILEQCGCVVAVAADAEGALAKLGDVELDVLVSDIGMPVVDGYSLIRSVRSHRKGSVARIPAIALTAYARSEDRAHAVRAGFDMHLTKPVEPSELLAIVAALVERMRRQA